MKTLQTHFKRAHLFLACGLIGVLVTLCACGGGITRAKASTPKNNQSSAFPLLKKSLQAFSTIESLHMTLQSRGMIQTALGLLPPLMKESTYTLTGQADIVPPKREAQGTIEIAVTQPGQQKIVIKASEIVSAQKLYVLEKNNHWLVLSLASLQVNGDLRMRPSISDLVALLEHVTVVDHGIQVQGQFHLHHLTLTVDTQALSQLLGTQQPMLKLILNNVQVMKPVSIDVFLDEMTGLPHQIELKGKAQLNIDALLGIHRKSASDVGLAGRTVTVSFDTTVILSNVNKPVTLLPVPAKATPINPSLITNL